MQGLGLADQVRAARAAANICRLLLLADLWTGYLAQTSGAIPPQDRATLNDLTKEMDALLSGAEQEAAGAQTFADQHGNQLDQAYAAALEKVPVPDDVRASVRAKIGQQGGFHGLALGQSGHVKDGIGQERHGLADKMAKANGGGDRQAIYLSRRSVRPRRRWLPSSSPHQARRSSAPTSSSRWPRSASERTGA